LRKSLIIFVEKHALMLKKRNILAGTMISAILFFACLATIVSLGQISIKASTENMTSSSGSGNASMMMANKTAANSDVLMNKVRNMANSTIAAGSGSASSNMTNQTSG
jgi:hypothetical protein